MKQKNLLRSSVVLIAAAFATPALASGYHFGTQSVNAQSTANASTAEAADPSTVFHNPAGLTHLPGTQATINANIVMPSVKYRDAEAYYPGLPGAQQAVQGQTSGRIDPGVTIAPHVYASHQLNDRVSLGVGLYVPFGSGTEYDHDSVLRYNLNELGLKTMAIQPTVAFKINDQHSVAVGLVAQHTEAELRQYANFGSVLGARGISGQGNGTADGYAAVEGSDWGFGYNLAWLWDINDSVRMGVNYRSKIDHTLSGDAEWKLVGDVFSHPVLGTPTTNAIRANGYAAHEDASVKITTPESLSLHGMWRVNPKWNVFGDITWTRHSRFNRANLQFGNMKTVGTSIAGDMEPNIPGTQSNQTILTPNWRDTVKVSLGASYQINDPLQLRFGVAYDQSPVRGADSRMTTLPDNDRIWLSLGLKYDINEKHSINAAYSYIFIKNASANVNGYCGADNAVGQACVSSKTNGSANFRSSSSILGLQYTYKF